MDKWILPKLPADGGQKGMQVGNEDGGKALMVKPLATGCDVSSPAFPPKAQLRKYATAGLLTRSFFGAFPKLELEIWN